MTLKEDDLVCYAATSMPEDEVSLNGGNIGGLRVDWGSVLDQTYTVSGVPGDAIVTVTVRMRGGHKVAITHTGGGTFDFGDTPIELLKVESNKGFADGGKIGSVTVGVPVCTMKLGDTGITQMFIDAFAEDKFGNTKVYYMKFFWKNTSPTDTVKNAVISKSKLQIIHPKDLISFALVAAKRDASGTANRLTSPDETIFNDADKLVPGLDLAPSDYIGVWLAMKLQPVLTPGGFAYKSQCIGQVAGIP